MKRVQLLLAVESVLRMLAVLVHCWALSLGCCHDGDLVGQCYMALEEGHRIVELELWPPNLVAKQAWVISNLSFFP